MDTCSKSKVGDTVGTEEQTWSVQVRHGAKTFRIDLKEDATLRGLNDAIEEVTHVVPCLQKLCCQGKVLREDSQLQELVRKNAKILLLPMGPTGGVTSLGSEKMKEHMLSKQKKPKKATGQSHVTCLEERKRTWQATKVASLLDLGLTSLPLSCFDPNTQLRKVDISGNPVKEIPKHFFESLRLVRKLKMDRCELDNESMDWRLLAKLNYLEIFSLRRNQLTSIPSGIGGLPSLQTLDLGSNDIKDISSELSKLNRLAVLDLSSNNIKQVSENAFPLSLEALSLEKNDLRLLPPMRLPHLNMLQLECNPRCASLFIIPFVYKILINKSIILQITKLALLNF